MIQEKSLFLKKVIFLKKIYYMRFPTISISSASSLAFRLSKKVLTFLLWFTVSTLVWVVIILTWSAYDISQPQALVAGAYTTEHFTVIYDGLPTSDAEYIGKQLERERSRIIADFGVTYVPHVVVYLYSEGNKEFVDRYRGAMNVSEIGGFVDNDSLTTLYVQWVTKDSSGREFLNVIAERSYVSALAEHEFTHIVTHESLYEKALADGAMSSRADWERQCRYGGVYCQIPTWFSEALAQYESRLWGDGEILFAYKDHIETLDPTLLQGKDQYSYGRLIVEYIVKEWGVEGLRSMVSHNANIEEALGVSTDTFNTGFRVHASERIEGLMLQYTYAGTLLVD